MSRTAVSDDPRVRKSYRRSQIITLEAITHDMSDKLFRRVAWEHNIDRFGSHSFRCWQRLTIEFAVGIERQRVKYNEVGRHHVVGQVRT